MVSAANNCTDTACLCKTSVIKATATCLDCNIAVNPAPYVINEAKHVLEQVEKACADAGDPVTSLTVSGFVVLTVVASTGAVTATIPVVTSNTPSPSIFFSSTGARASSSPRTAVTSISQMSIPVQQPQISISGSQSPSTFPVVGFSSTGSESGVSPGDAPTPTGGAGSAVASGDVFKLASTSTLAWACVVGGATLWRAF
ncbi:hypothetical protein BC835DRAFT_1421151 [Cytidiella melzeri]|nr:hypothetical protein BC835DRAFT_1421151 [Cytidiella melzeri]